MNTVADVRKTTEQKMHKSLDALKTDLAKVRTGRAHTGLLDHITVDYYGTSIQISKVANVSLLDARTLGVSPWEKKMLGVIEKAIRESDLGLNPAKQGGETVRRVTRACGERGVEYLTLFAFSSENWLRPAQEVSTLKQLFMAALEQEAERLHRNKVRLQIIGDIAPFGARVVELARRAQELTSANSGLTLTIAANYGGRWDLMQALAKLIRSGPLPEDGFTEEQVASQLALNYAPEPDLFIRTGGEQRISNFLLWQLAYTELYFTPTLWPDFDAAQLDAAIAWYRERERRFGRTSEQLEKAKRDANGRRRIA